MTKIAGLVLRFVPDAILNRILPKKYHYDPDLMVVAQAPDTPIRLFIGPVNFAGQGWQWARAAERNIDGVGAVSMAYRIGNEFGYPVDLSVPAAGYVLSSAWQRRERHAVQSGFTHVIVEAERRLFGRVYDQTVEQQVRQLTAAGLRVAMLCHGSDIRLPSRHAAMNRNSPFRENEWEETELLESEARKNRAILDRLGLPVFVSTPGLMEDVPYARWLPVVIDYEKWRGDVLPLEQNRPIVVHAPSHPGLKGSNLIDPVMRRLHDERVIEYRRIEGVPADQVPALYGSADIILDQFRLGDYGVAACEALSAGRIVIGHVEERVRAHVKRATGMDLPIVEATPDTLESAIRSVVASPADYASQAEDGKAFAREVHDGRLSASVMKEFLCETGAPST